MKKIVLAIFCFIATPMLFAQKLTVQQYIDTYKDFAIEEMVRSGVPASITLAQGILETENGNSDLVKQSNNHFGIKCKSNWTGPSVRHTDDAPNECFRKYNSALDSYRDHSDYLKNSPRYAALFKLSPDDYKGWAYGLKRAGYATNPQYPQILIKNIEQYNLQQYNTADAIATLSSNKPIEVKETQPQMDIVAATVITPKTKEQNNPIEKNAIPLKKVKTLFNSLKAVFADKQTSLLAIAATYDIPLSQLLDYNDLKTDAMLKESQWIYLEKKPKQGNRDYYTAIENESLYHISQTNAVQLQSLMQYNQMHENELVRVGKKIRLRPSNTVVASSSTKIMSTAAK